MNKSSLACVLLVFCLCVLPVSAQKKDRDAIREAVEAVLSAKSYQRMLSYTDAVNGTALNGAGKISRFTDDDLKNRRLFKDDVYMALPDAESWLIVVEKTIATVRLESMLVSNKPEKTSGARFQNYLTLVKRNNVWIVSDWAQIQLQEEPVQRPERKEWR